ncbi:facilitated trehalose transporter Tret1-like [Coccinella septempunctata]|uniref:facilitated trehalose transporter Tret1-like n=1 Tax=Coccinella septempunctata TaxID=41139 RepID=UPI001D06898A|nr:facilitated trehalose transporter Tret1-like [Coccinella septempunctata]
MKDHLQQMFAGTFYQLLAAISGTFSAISDGMQYGWSAPLIPVLQAPDSPIKITDTDVYWLETIYLIGGVAGLPITIYFVDKIGRQKSLIIAASNSFTAWILIVIANRVEYLYVARFLTGLAMDVAFVSAPMYVAEIADQKIRGFLASLIFLMMLSGIIIIYVLAPFFQLWVSSVVGALILLTQLATFPFMPESPYFLLLKGKKEKARKALCFLRDKTDIEDELKEIESAIERQKSEKGRPQDLLLIHSNRKALTIMMVLNAAQQFSCMSVILMNLHFILESAGTVYMDSKVAAIIFSVLMFFAAAVASIFIDRYGRKILLISSSILTSISLFALAVYFNLQYLNYDVLGVSWIPIASVMVYALVFKFGLGMVPIVLTAEIFPTKVKAMGMTVADATYVIFGVITISLFQYLLKIYGMHVPFYLFAALCLATAIFSHYYIPETKSKTLEEIQMILKGLHVGNEKKLADVQS